MVNMMSPTALAGGPNVPPPLRTDYQEEVLVNAIKKIGFVAACIDLYDWRNVIDEVLEEIEAENEARLLELEIACSLPLPPEAGVSGGSAVLPRPAS
jgi:hypothetical protein